MARKTQSTAADSSAGSELVATGKGVGKTVGGYVLAKTLPYTPPWVGAAVLPPLAGWATNTMWGDDAMSAGLASAGLALGGAALAAVTWKTSGSSTKFRKFRRAQATATVAAGMGWLTCAVSAGPFGRPMLDLWLLGGGLLAASWNARQLLANGQGADPEETNESGSLGKLAAAIGWEKVAVKDAQGTGKGTVKAAIEVAPGSDIAAVQATTAKVAAALQVPPSGVIVTPDPENGARGTVSLRVADLLKGGVAFFMPDAFGLLPTHPIPVGLYADGELWLLDPFSPAVLQHLLVMGVTGAGKSEFARAVFAHLATRAKVALHVIDLAKGDQTVGHIRDGIDWLIQDPKEAKRYVKALPAAIRARGSVLSAEGLDRWTPASSLSAVAVWIEEAADTASFEELEEIARKARSVGIWLIISLQRATWTNMSTDIRANLQAAACFGVDQASDAGFCLPDSVTDAGAVPAWGSSRPGYAYATGMGIPQERWTMEARSSLTDRSVLAALVAAAAPYRDPLDETTAAALGQTYAQRTHRGTNKTTPGIERSAAAARAWLASVDIEFGSAVTASTDPANPAFPPFPGGAPATAQAAPPAPAAIPATRTAAPLPGPATSATDEDDDMTDIEDAATVEIQDAYDEIMGTIPADPEPDADYAHLDLDDDVPAEDPDSDIEFEAPARVSTEEARHRLYTELDLWVTQSRLEFQPADLIPATVAAGRKRPWLQGELKRLVAEGTLAHDSHGVYTILHSPLQPA
ncbi:FtsK/SpoIIIE domain-containing protein [Streptomyces sp. NPDC006339]|uniref:FtsK/SpoIIIE domain-containing protein n=1 Tax=Streptomyces sp. NPDC006339 TaxID=3156755 RepID=UPI0033BB2072